MERLKLVEKEVRSDVNKDSPDQLERFKAVVKNLTEDALEVLNRVAVDEIGKPEPKPQLVEGYYLLFHYLCFIKRFVSGMA